MKDKEKQDCNNCVCKTVCYERASIEDIEGYKSKAMKSWEAYVKQYGCQYYQPKLPEGSVVLSMEECEAHKKWLKELAKSNKEFEKIGYEKGSKETAEKIYYKAEKKAHFQDGGYYDKDRYYLDMEDLKEILKGLGVEIKE